jgi:TatD DNase family protein
MPTWIDTHAHLSSDSFEGDLEGVLERARQADVRRVVVIGTTEADSRRAIELSDQYPMLSPTVGTHPNNILEQSSEEIESVLKLMEDPRVVGIGETGLDRYWKTVPFDRQVESFSRHLTRGHELRKPVVIHCRDAEEETLAELARHADRTGEPIAGVLHSFVGSARTAEQCLSLGLHLSFAGMLTFKKNESLRELAASIPLDRLLIETDSPYLSPEPMRGKPNEPARVVFTGGCLARVKGLSEAALAEATTRNACRLFGISID